MDLKKEQVIDLINYKHDATPSWSGYNHQGKVALYIAIQKINELRLNREECKLYELELDLIEDFSILLSGNYIEAHQVKTYKQKTLSKYRNSIWELLAKAKDIHTTNKVYLHTVQPIDDVENIKLNITSPPEETINDDSKEKVNNSIIKKSPRQCYELVVNSENYSEIWDKFKVYKYGSKDCCDIDEISEKIEEEIEKFNCEFKQHTNRAYLVLLRLIDKNVSERHLQIRKNYKGIVKRINFQEIFDLLNENHSKTTKEYCISKLKDRFNRYIQEYIIDLKETDSIIEKINFLSKIIMSLEEEKFLEFCRIIAPHQVIDQEDYDELNEKINELCSERELFGFLTIINNIEKELHEEKYIFHKKIEDGSNLNYLPTTITYKEGSSIIDRLIVKIINNSTLNDEILHEVDVLINESINRQDLSSTKITENYFDGDTRKSDKFVNIKNIRMIDINIAKGELSE